MLGRCWGGTGEGLGRDWGGTGEGLATRCHASFLCELPLCHVPRRGADSQESRAPQPDPAAQGLQQRRDKGAGEGFLVNCTRGVGGGEGLDAVC